MDQHRWLHLAASQKCIISGLIWIHWLRIFILTRYLGDLHVFVYWSFRSSDLGNCSVYQNSTLWLENKSSVFLARFFLVDDEGWNHGPVISTLLCRSSKLHLQLFAGVEEGNGEMPEFIPPTTSIYAIRRYINNGIYSRGLCSYKGKITRFQGIG